MNEELAYRTVGDAVIRVEKSATKAGYTVYIVRFYDGVGHYYFEEYSTLEAALEVADRLEAAEETR